jgi:hypothetical protein
MTTPTLTSTEPNGGSQPPNQDQSTFGTDGGLVPCVHHLALLNCLQNLDVLDGHRLDLQRALVEDDEIGKLARFQ